MRLECGRCALRPWRVGDEASLARHANDRDVWLNLRDQFPHPYTKADAQSWIGFATSQPQFTSLAIEVERRAVGGISLRLHDDVERVAAEIGYWLGKAFWNRGVMTAALRSMTQYGFEQFSLTRIYALPFAGNAASQRVLEKAGYTREGVLRRSAIKDGRVTDQVMFAIIDRDFPVKARR